MDILIEIALPLLLNLFGAQAKSIDPAEILAFAHAGVDLVKQVMSMIADIQSGKIDPSKMTPDEIRALLYSASDEQIHQRAVAIIASQKP